MTKITDKWLKENNVCQDAVSWLKTIKDRNIDNLFNLIISSKDNEKLSWGNWIIVRLMNHKQRVKYAIFAAEQVIDIYEKEYPDDNRPRKAIESAKYYLENQTGAANEAAYVAYAASAAANAAAYAAYAANEASAAANEAANEAAYAAAYAASAANEAAYVANAAANAAAYAANAAAYATVDIVALRVKILTYGMELIKNENKTR